MKNNTMSQLLTIPKSEAKTCFQLCICTVHLTRSLNHQTNACTLTIFIY